MKKLFYRLSSSRSFTKLFSLHARLEERRGVMFSKSSVCAVLALLGFLSLGAFFFPQVGHAQCIWDCDLGSDPSFNPWGNSPQALDIAYCIDRDCVLNLRDGDENLIFTGNSIPTPNVKLTNSTQSCSGTRNVTISGSVVALLRDSDGNLQPASATMALLDMVIKGVICETGTTNLLRVVELNEAHTAVFGGSSGPSSSSSITILAPTTSTPANLPALGWTGCTTAKNTGKLLANCTFLLGTEVYTRLSERDAHFPATSFFPAGGVFRAEAGTAEAPLRKVAVRDCKGEPNSTDPSKIDCGNGPTVEVGGGESVALFTFRANVSGAENHTINKNGTNVPVDVGPTSLFENIDFTDAIITASANGPEVPLTGCFTQDNQQTVRCFLSAQALLPTGCTKNQPVAILVQGDVVIGDTTFRFVGRDAPKCGN